MFLLHIEIQIEGIGLITQQACDTSGIRTQVSWYPLPSFLLLSFRGFDVSRLYVSLRYHYVLGIRQQMCSHIA